VGLSPRRVAVDNLFGLDTGSRRNGIDPGLAERNCLADMITKFNAFRAVFLLLGMSLSPAAVGEIPVHRFHEPTHGYWTRAPVDAFNALVAKQQAGNAVSFSGDAREQLVALLKTLDIAVSSQMLVYSATSLQSGLILPSNPRAIYFNEEVYVGYAPGGRLEVAAVDPALGPVFYLAKSDSGRPLQVQRSERCMNCHAGRTSWGVPGLVAESVIATVNSGASLDGFRREQAGHTIPLSERLGGWHVTGAHEQGGHLGNLLGTAEGGGYTRYPNPPGSRFHWDHYPVATSDLFAHLLHEHQIGFHNLVTLGLYRTRDALAAGGGAIRAEDRAELDEIAWKLVRYLLFSGEAALPEGGLKPDSRLLADFTARRIAGPSGRSLRDLDLAKRLFTNRCSYMIYTRGFSSLPAEFKRRVLKGLTIALSENGAPAEFDYLPAQEKGNIRLILRETGIFGP
jgi:hypothetical protein